VKIFFDNGRDLTVTPEHPIFVIEDGKIVTKEARDIEEGEYSPGALRLTYRGEDLLPNIVPSGRKRVVFPEKMNEALSRIIGFIVTDGGIEINRGKPSGILFTNKDKELVEIFNSDIKALFGIEPYLYVRKDGLIYSRVLSKDVYAFFKNLDEKLVKTKKEKALPELIFGAERKVKKELLRAIFEADGHIKKDGLRIGLTSESRVLLEQVQEILLEFGIYSYIRDFGTYSRLFITGDDYLLAFFEEIGFISQKKNSRLKAVLEKPGFSRTIKDVLPNSGILIKNLLKKLKLSQKEVFGYTLTFHGGSTQFSRRKLRNVFQILDERVEKIKRLIVQIKNAEDIETLKTIRESLRISQCEMGDLLGVCHQTISNWELKKTGGDFGRYRDALFLKAEKMINPVEDKLNNLKKILSPTLCPIEVIKKEIIENTDQEWVYDIQVEPTHNFISKGLILHNSVSIAKAGMLATFRARCSILAAANPKYGRFDDYRPISEQINLSPTLLSRFDLIFFVRDVLEETREVARHILDTVTSPDVIAPRISPELLRKYIAYARQNIFPVLTEEAKERVEGFYVEMRKIAKDAEGVPIPLTARQLWAILRIARASARVRLSDETTIEDVERAIRLIKLSLEQAGLDLETGKVDIDKIMVGVTKSQRDRLTHVLDIIKEIEKEYGTAKKSEIIERALEEGIPEGEVEKAIEKLRIDGYIFEPRVDTFKSA
jgi:replicative DNA helicase Mcm